MSSLDEKARMASHPCSSSSITLHAPSGVSASHRTPSPPADRQNALCKAMGALFLQHRVHCLEEDVAKLDRKHQLLGGRHKGRGERGAGSHAGREPSKKAGCPFQKKVEKDKSGAAGEAKSEGRAQLLVVVDASVLIYSLRSVHEWLKEGKTRIVIPEEGELEISSQVHPHLDAHPQRYSHNVLQLVEPWTFSRRRTIASV